MVCRYDLYYDEHGLVCVHVGLIDGTTVDSENHERNMQELAKELKKPNPRSSVVKVLRKHTFKGRTTLSHKLISESCGWMNG